MAKKQQQEKKRGMVRADEAKFKELVLYVAARCYNDPAFGAVKLNKILFYSDFFHYAATGKPITGVEYRKLPHGPAPAKMKAFKHQLERDEAAYEYLNPLATGYQQKRLLAQRKPDLSRFTAEEISMVDWVIEHVRDHNAREISEISHRLSGWSLANDQETIPYFTALIPDCPPEFTEDEMTWLRGVADRLSRTEDRAAR